MSVIYRFTLKKDMTSAVETHYVRANTIERAAQALSVHLSVPIEILRHNPKNVPYKVREKILARITETVDGKTTSYGLTLDLKNETQEETEQHASMQQATSNNTSTSTTPNSITGSTTNTTSNTTVDSNKAVSGTDASLTQYNTYRYDIEHLFKEDRETLVKYAGYSTGVNASTVVNNTTRKRAYDTLRDAIIRDGVSHLIYRTNNTTNTNKANHRTLDRPTMLEVLDAYQTNFLNRSTLA